MTKKKTWLTTAEVADEIRVSPEFVSRQCAAGEIKAKKVGNEWRIHWQALEEFMSGEAPTTPLRTLTARQKRQSA